MAVECHVRRFRDVSYSATKNFYGISDVHAGNRNIRECLLDDTIAIIADDPDAYWFGLGDYGDWIAFSDKRFEAYEVADWVNLADPWMSTLDWLEEKFTPIADKCLGLIRGNHEVTVAKRYHMHVHKHFCARLGVLDLGSFCFYRMIFHKDTGQSRRAYDNVLTHGWGGGRTPGARVNKLAELMKHNIARMYWMGHMHGDLPTLNSNVRRMSPKNKLLYEQRIGVITGTYLQDAEYERMNGYPPSIVGSPHVAIEVFKDKMSVKL